MWNERIKDALFCLDLISLLAITIINSFDYPSDSAPFDIFCIRSVLLRSYGDLF